MDQDKEEFDANAEHNTEDGDPSAHALGSPWYSNSLFSRFWKKYTLAWAWYRQHCQLISHNQGCPTASWMYPGQPPNFPPFSTTFCGENQRGPVNASEYKHICQTRDRSKRASRRKHKRRRKLLKEKQVRLNSETSEGGANSGECEDEGDQITFEMEITPEMREFFEKSAKHKKERREAQQKEREESESTDYIDLTEVTVHTKRMSVAPPRERPVVKRTEQMKWLYGAGAAMIHGMETALQLNFDRNFDLKTPKLWPHLPLNITFYS